MSETQTNLISAYLDKRNTLTSQEVPLIIMVQQIHQTILPQIYVQMLQDVFVETINSVTLGGHLPDLNEEQS